MQHMILGMYLMCAFPEISIYWNSVNIGQDVCGLSCTLSRKQKLPSQSKTITPKVPYVRIPYINIHY